MLHTLSDLKRHFYRNLKRQLRMPKPGTQISAHVFLPTDVLRDYVWIPIKMLNPISAHNKRVFFEPHPRESFFGEHVAHRAIAGMTLLKSL